MVWYAKGIQRVEEELGLVISSFPNLFELGAMPPAATSEGEKNRQTNKNPTIPHMLELRYELKKFFICTSTLFETFSTKMKFWKQQNL